MIPTYTQLPLATGQQIHIIKDLLDEAECASIISQHKNLVPSNVTPHTVRDRETFDDPALSNLISERLRKFYNERGGNENDGKQEKERMGGIERVVEDEDGCLWEVEGLNPRFRLCRYLPGMSFPIFEVQSPTSVLDLPSYKQFLELIQEPL